MWKLMALAVCLLMVLPAHSKMAGGMVHWVNEDVDISPDGIMRYVAGTDDTGTAAILEKEKAYYSACIDKTLSRLELARSRVDSADLTRDERSMLYGRLDSGKDWLEAHRSALLSAKDLDTFERTVDLKAWHAVKMLPTASEGYAIACAMEKRLDGLPGSKDKSEAAALIGSAKSTFLRLLNLGGKADFVAAEKDRIEAFGQLSQADDRLKRNG